MPECIKAKAGEKTLYLTTETLKSNGVDFSEFKIFKADSESDAREAWVNHLETHGAVVSDEKGFSHEIGNTLVSLDSVKMIYPCEAETMKKFGICGIEN